MQKNSNVPTWAWDYYQSFQERAAESHNEAEEEALDYLVRLFRNRKTPAMRQELERLVDNHLAGNRQRVRRRNSLLEKYLSPGNGRETDDRLASRDSLEAIRQNVTPVHWQLLNGIANGYGYQELSSSFGIPSGTLKSTVSRVRSSLQELAAH